MASSNFEREAHVASRRNVILSGLSSLAFPAICQTFPARPVKIVVPFTAGGTADHFARVLAAVLEKRWGQALLVDARPGGGTVIGTTMVAKAPPDGHTLLLVASSFVILPKLHKNLTYDGIRAFVPVAVLAESPQVLLAGPATPSRTFPEWVRDVRRRGGAASIGSSGPASGQHVAIEMLKQAAQIQPTYVPYSGGAAALNAVLGGHIDAIVTNFSEVAGHIETGKLRALAVMSPRRLEQLKDIPTVAESGFPDYDATAWFGVVAPLGTPTVVVAKLADDLKLAMQDPALLAALPKMGLRPGFKGPGEASTYIAAKYEQFARVIDDSGMKLGN
jgi:tripartite-type tricarboxylate transporter receptor subunit TctC